MGAVSVGSAHPTRQADSAIELPGERAAGGLDATGTEDQQAAQAQSPVTPCAQADSLCSLPAVRDGEVAALCVRQLRVRESQARPAKRAGNRVGGGQRSGRSLVRAAVDVMGGDKAPAAILKGCWEAAPLLNGGDKVLLVGDESVIKKGLEASGLDSAAQAHYTVIPTTDVIAMDDPPVEAVRSKPNSSISVMCKLASKGEAEAVISAGNTGAVRE